MKQDERPTIGEWIENALDETTLSVVLLLWFGGVPVNVGLWFALDWLFPAPSFFAIVAHVWTLMFNAAWLVYSVVRTFDWLDWFDG